MLQSFWRRILPRPPLDIAKAINIIVGRNIHLVLQKYFPLGKKEVTVQKGYRASNGDTFTIVGRVDVLCEDYIIEFKSISELFDKLRLPIPHHYDQVQLYMWLTNTSKAYILYIAKKVRSGGQPYRIVEVYRDEKRIGELLDKAAKLHRALKSGVPPEPTPNALCRYCEFKDRCSACKEQE